MIYACIAVMCFSLYVWDGNVQDLMETSVVLQIKFVDDITLKLKWRCLKIWYSRSRCPKIGSNLNCLNTFSPNSEKQSLIHVFPTQTHKKPNLFTIYVYIIYNVILNLMLCNLRYLSFTCQLWFCVMFLCFSMHNESSVNRKVKER